MRLVLASGSPRRADLLRAAGFEFVVRPALVDESRLPGEHPEDYVRRLAATKAAAIASAGERDVVVGADTIVLLDGDILGKPADDDDAAGMLARLSGRTHEVLTGVAVQRGVASLVGVERAQVRFAPIDADEIAWYVATGEPRDKAGAYGIQGLASRFVERIEGSYATVVGLPVHMLRRLLRDLQS